MKWDENRNEKSWNFGGIYYIKTMGTYCISFKKYTANEKSTVRKTKQNRLMILSSFAICDKRKSTYIRIKNSAILIVFEMISLK